ncbi:MAG: PEP-CTERM sorting domain-containing protein [Chloroflexi bacterium]|nr:PEP-CTERM sorting domain-containing protein [Chloroflexota bacterium]
MKNPITQIIFISAVVILFGNGTAEAAWCGLSPGGYGFSYQPQIVLTNGDKTLHEFTFEGMFGNSSACDFVPSVVLDIPFSQSELFCSLDPVQYITRKDWPLEHLSAGETRYVSFTVYISNPNLGTILPDRYYRISPWWQPYFQTSGGGIDIIGEIGGVIRMQIIPEPATLLLLGFGGVLVRRKTT